MQKIYTCMAIIAVMLLSCSTGQFKKDTSLKSEDKAGINYMAEKPGDQNKTMAIDTVALKVPDPSINVSTHNNWDKKIIKTAEVILELKNYAAYDHNIHNGLSAYGAYIAQEEQNFSEGRAANTVTIKVPVEQFDNLMNSFSGDSISVVQKKISSEDVTGELVDTKSRMEAKKQMRERYLELLKQAKNMKEILEVQQEINSIQEEIESAGGRVNYLGHQSAYSTIHLQYFQYTNGEYGGTHHGYLVQLKEGFKTGINIIGGILVFIVAIWPLLVIAFVSFYFWKKHTTKTTRV